MKEDMEKKAREIVGDLQCPKDFKCCKGGFNNLCKAKDIGMETFLKCLEEKPRCKFACRIGYSNYCTCPLRIHIIKHLGK